MKIETLDAIGAAGNKATIVGGSVAVFGKMSSADLAAYTGAAVAIIGLLITWYYKREANKRQAADERRREREIERRDEERRLRMEMMRTSGRPIYHEDSDLGVLGMDECAPVPMHQYEFDAFASFTYNVGPGRAGVKDGFCELKRGGPSSIVRRLLAGDYTGACDALLSWDKFNGKPLRGLTLRREREREQCLGNAS